MKTARGPTGTILCFTISCAGREERRFLGFCKGNFRPTSLAPHEGKSCTGRTVSKLFFQLQTELGPTLRAGDLRKCDQRIAEALRGLPISPFHIALGLHFTNPPDAVAKQFDAFFRRERDRFPIAAAYTETNGFDINPNRWYFDFFAYDTYGGTDDFDWLSDWTSDPWPNMTLTGMEALQAVYASTAFRDHSHRDASYVTSLLVVSRFQLLMAQACTFMNELRFPFLSTGHDFEYISEVQQISI